VCAVIKYIGRCGGCDDIHAKGVLPPKRERTVFAGGTAQCRAHRSAASATVLKCGASNDVGARVYLQRTGCHVRRSCLPLRPLSAENDNLGPLQLHFGFRACRRAYTVIKSVFTPDISPACTTPAGPAKQYRARAAIRQTSSTINRGWLEHVIRQFFERLLLARSNSEFLLVRRFIARSGNIVGTFPVLSRSVLAKPSPSSKCNEQYGVGRNHAVVLHGPATRSRRRPSSKTSRAPDNTSRLLLLRAKCPSKKSDAFLWPRQMTILNNTARDVRWSTVADG